MTAMTTPFAFFKFPFMPFGLRNVAQNFHSFMDEILKDLDFCFAYVEDILLFICYSEEHDQHRILFTKLQICGILLNPAKCVFRDSEISFLGKKSLPCVPSLSLNELLTSKPLLPPKP
jgi:hypothetical protein